MDGGLLFNSLRPYLIDQPLFHHGHTGSPDQNKFEMLFVADGALVKHAVPPRCRIMGCACYIQKREETSGDRRRMAKKGTETKIEKEEKKREGKDKHTSCCCVGTL